MRIRIPSSSWFSGVEFPDHSLISISLLERVESDPECVLSAAALFWTVLCFVELATNHFPSPFGTFNWVVAAVLALLVAVASALGGWIALR